MPNATRCARVIVNELIAAGVRDVVLSPGSRSAPLAYEIYEADHIGLLRLHVRIDERTAGFLALGLAKASPPERGVPTPVAVITTSGTAAANLHPAVLEAWHSAVPLIMITADRPRSATFTGANQTTDQHQLFGRHVRAEVGLEDLAGDQGWWQFELGRLLAAATGARTGQPGPVHLNVSFSEPLLPEVSATPTARELVVTPRATTPEPYPLDGGPQTVIVAGDLPPDQGRAVAEQAAASGIPLLAEPSSNARRGPAAMGSYRLLLRSSLGIDVERAVVFGHPTLSRPVNRLLARDDIEVIVVTDRAEWTDPGRAAHVVADAVDLEPGSPDWLTRWREADQLLRSELDALVARQAMTCGPAVAARVWAALTGSDTLVSGSSSPIRDLDLAAISQQPPTVYANRGLAGIDGTISTAVGVALATERPTHALMGDETFLHDLTGLLVSRSEPRPDLRIVVADDDGGSIFATLEQGHPSLQRSFERIFAAAPGVDLQAAAAGLGVKARRVRGLDELDDVLAEPPIGIEVVVIPVDRAQRRTLNEQLSGLAATLEAGGWR